MKLEVRHAGSKALLYINDAPMLMPSVGEQLVVTENLIHVVTKITLDYINDVCRVEVR